jgi:hypothetical protein
MASSIDVDSAARSLASSTATVCQPNARKRASTSSVAKLSDVSPSIDPVVVVQIDKSAEPEMTRQRRRLSGHSLHQIAVGAQREHAVIHHLSAVALA